MLTRILHNSDSLSSFLSQLELNLSKPQLHHVTNIADALLVCESRKTLAALQRQFVEATDPSNMADSLRIGPWLSQDLRDPLTAFLVRFAHAQAAARSQEKIIHLSIDDSIGPKHKETKQIEPVDFFYDHIESTRNHPRYKNGITYLVLTLSTGQIRVTLDLRLYLRARTVRRINRNRSPSKRVPFISKSRLARAMLRRIAPLLPVGYKVYVHFDSWYASAKLIKFIHRQHWHRVCAIKQNRKLNGIPINQLARSLLHQRYSRVRLGAADNQTTYLVPDLTGRLEDVAADIRVYISKRHHRDRSPEYFVSTDLALNAKSALEGYGRRWYCEVDNLYLKTYLGLCDFRVQSYEAVDKWCAIVHLAWAYVEWRFISERSPQTNCPSDIIERHREEQTVDWLKGALEMVLSTGDVEMVLKKFLRQSN